VVEDKVVMDKVVEGGQGGGGQGGGEGRTRWWRTLTLTLWLRSATFPTYFGLT
jgi:hypothetical protein